MDAPIGRQTAATAEQTVAWLTQFYQQDEGEVIADRHGTCCDVASWPVPEIGRISTATWPTLRIRMTIAFATDWVCCGMAIRDRVR